MLQQNRVITANMQTLGGMAQRNISATKRYRGYIQHIQYQAQAEQEIALWLPTLARLSQDTGWVLWVAPPFSLNSEVFNAAGISAQRILTIEPNHAAQAFSLVDTALQCQHYSAVFWWSPELTAAQHQTLEHAARIGESVGIMMSQSHVNKTTHKAH